jgi:hypothetical protein
MSTEASETAEVDDVGDDEASESLAPNNVRLDVGDWFAKTMPHVAPATDSPNEESIWFEVLENEELAQKVASSMGYPDFKEMDTVVHVIRDDFREFFFPINSTSGYYESELEHLKDNHLADAVKWNDDLEYDAEVKELDIGGQADDKENSEGEAVDWNEVMSADDTEDVDDTGAVEDDLDEVFSDV